MHSPPMAKLTYSMEELMAVGPCAARPRHQGVLFHGGLDAQGRNVPPRSAHRVERLLAEFAELGPLPETGA